MKTLNECTGITTNKIYKLLHNGGIKDKYSIKGALTKCLRFFFFLMVRLSCLFIFVTVEGKKAGTKAPSI